MAASQRMGVPCCACWQEVSHRLAARLVRHVLERAWVPTVQDLLWTWRRPAGRPRPWHLGWAALGNLGASRTQNFCDIVPISCVSYLPHPIPPSSSPPHCHFSLASPPRAASTCAACPPRDSPTCTCCPPTTSPPSTRTRRRGGMWVSRDPRMMLDATSGVLLTIANTCCCLPPGASLPYRPTGCGGRIWAQVPLTVLLPQSFSLYLSACLPLYISQTSQCCAASRPTPTSSRQPWWPCRTRTRSTGGEGQRAG